MNGNEAREANHTEGVEGPESEINHAEGPQNEGIAEGADGDESHQGGDSDVEGVEGPESEINHAEGPQNEGIAEGPDGNESQSEGGSNTN